MLKKKLSILLFLLLFIFLLNLSTAYCYTIDDFLTQVEIIKEINIDNAYNLTADYILNSADKLKQAELIDTYSSFVVQTVDSATNNNNSYITIWAWANESNVSFEDNGNYTTCRFDRNISYRIYQISKNTGQVTRGNNQSKNNFQSNRGFGLISHLNNNVNWMGYYNNIYIGISPVEYPNYTPKIPFTIAFATIGQNYINCSFELWRNNQKINANLITYDSTTNNGVSRTIQLNSKITNNKEYTLKAYNSGDFIIESSPFIIKYSEELQPGTITNESGDITGQINLTETNNKIDLVNSSIIAQTQAIISGDRSIVDAIRSGDVAIINAITNSNYSGELALSDLPQIDIDDPTYDFFQWLLAHFQAFFTNFDNTTLVIPLWDTNYEIASNIFILNIDPLKTFISIAWWFVCGIPLLKWIRHTIETVRSGNIPQVDDKSDLLGNVL